jgi:hypothetical protein
MPWRKERDKNWDQEVMVSLRALLFLTSFVF